MKLPGRCKICGLQLRNVHEWDSKSKKYCPSCSNLPSNIAVMKEEETKKHNSDQKYHRNHCGICNTKINWVGRIRKKYIPEYEVFHKKQGYMFVCEHCLDWNIMLKWDYWADLGKPSVDYLEECIEKYNLHQQKQEKQKEQESKKERIVRRILQKQNKIEEYKKKIKRLETTLEEEQNKLVDLDGQDE